MAKKETKPASSGKTPAKKAEASKAAAPGMPLFYRNPEPLSSEKHKGLGLRKNFGFGFTKHTNAVPINMIEMPQVCHAYPIAFSPDPNATPVAILGVRDNENLFLRPDGKWTGDLYIPSYIRRYPFIFSENPGKQGQFTLCVDMDDSIVEKNSTQPFFDKDKPSALSQNAVEFCKSYQAAALQTIEFGKALVASGLLIERAAMINLPNNQRLNFQGFRIIDEKKLQDMPEKDFLEWRRKGWLPFLYAHLFSGAQWHRITALLAERMKKEAA